LLIWLGEPRTFSLDASTCIRAMCDLSLFDSLLLDDINNNRLLDGLGELMKNIWFSRRWVVQELALARHATIHWVNFADAIAFYAMSYDSIKKSKALAARTPNRPKPLPEVKRLGPTVLVDATSNFVSQIDPGRSHWTSPNSGGFGLGPHRL